MRFCKPKTLGVAVRRVTLIGLVLAAVLATWSPLHAQVWTATRAVGGVFVDANGMLDNARIDDLDRLSQLRKRTVGEIPAELRGATELRKVSLRRLEEAIAECHANGKALPDEMECLAGLQQITHVFVYPEQQDIVLVGPAEGWKVDKRGTIVGLTTGRPVMLLDDLLTAFRTARQAAQGGIGCSIDPTDEGVVRFNQFMGQFQTMGNPQLVASGAERAVGAQNVTVFGVPETSHFARVLLAADYRMKRLAMNFEPSPVRGLPSFLSMMKGTTRRATNALPRWWLEPNYEPLLRSADGLAWELRGSAVKAMTMEDFVAADGSRQASGKASPLAQKWADKMTEHFDELAVAEPIFGQMRNCMELAIIGALISKERLAEKAGHSMSTLMDPTVVKTVELTAAKHVDSKASLLKRGRTWMVSVSGGVQIDSWFIADNVEQSAAPAEAREVAAKRMQDHWWWN